MPAQCPDCGADMIDGKCPNCDAPKKGGLPWVFILFALFAIALFLLPLLNFAFLL